MPQEVQSPGKRLRALYDLWASRAEGHIVPLRANFPAEDFKPWMGNISIIGVENNPRRFLLRLVGTEIVYYDRTDYTGRYMDDILKPPTKAVVLQQLEDCVRRRKAMAFRYRTTGFRELEAGIDKLFLPLSKDGETVSQILICLYASFIDPHADHRPTIQDYEVDGSTVAFDPRDL